MNICIGFWTLKVRYTQHNFVDKRHVRMQGQVFFLKLGKAGIVFLVGWKEKNKNCWGSLEALRIAGLGPTPLSQPWLLPLEVCRGRFNICQFCPTSFKRKLLSGKKEKENAIVMSKLRLLIPPSLGTIEEESLEKYKLVLVCLWNLFGCLLNHVS